MSKIKQRAAFINVQKGGLGKSTVTKNLSAVLGRDYNVLAVDFDPSGHLSKHLGFKEQYESGYKLSDYLDPAHDVELGDIIYDTGFGFDLLHSTNRMSHVISEFERQPNKDLVVKRNLVDPLLDDYYDYILFDTPADGKLMTKNAAAASGNLIMPLASGEQFVDGLSTTIEEIFKDYNDRLKGGVNLMAVVPNMIEQRIDHDNNDRELIESINTHNLDVVREAVPNFAHIPPEIWEKIDNGELSSNPKPGIRTHAPLDSPDPLTKVAPNSPAMGYFKELAEIVERGGVQRNENIVEKLMQEHGGMMA